MKKRYTRALTIQELAALPDSEIDTSDIPELGEEFWANAVLVAPPTKDMVTLRLDHDVLAWFKQAGKGYQTRINSVLRAFVQAQQPHGK